MKFSTIIVRETETYHLVCDGENFSGHYDGTQIMITHTGAFSFSVEKVPDETKTNKRKFQDQVPAPVQVPVQVPEKRVVPREPFVFIPTFF
jgi:hypothetical protein